MTISTLEPQLREHFEERAAIMEFDGNMPRHEAEKNALADTSAVMLIRRVMDMANKPKPIHMPKHEPVIDGKALAAGEHE